MAACKILSIRQFPILIPSSFWNGAQRNYIRPRALMKKMGFPEKPKRPTPPFIEFVRLKRATVMAQNPQMSFEEISGALSRQWNELSVSEKSKYNQEFKEKYAEYKVKLDEYNRGLTEKQKDEIKEIKSGYHISKKENAVITNVKKLEKEMNKPKNPVSPFVMYSVKNAHRLEGAKGVNKIKKYAEMWNSEPEAEREKYKTMFRKENEQYKKDLLKWEEEMMQQGYLDLVRLKTIKEKLQNRNK